MFNAVATIRTLILLCALSFPAFATGSPIACAISGSTFCGGSAAVVTYDGTGNTFSPGNVFTVELSDASGNFSSPVAIGSINGTAITGNVPITFPLATPYGTGYLIRVVASIPSTPGSPGPSPLTINPANNISVSISVPGTIVCDSNGATFTAIPTGTGPFTYSWTKNGIAVGGNSTIYNATGIADGDPVKVTMTSAAACSSGPAVSNTIVMTQMATATPAVTIAGPPVFCSGTNITFTATPSFGGPSPTYTWKRNGNVVGSNSDTFVTGTLNTGDVIVAEMASNRDCVSPDFGTSNAVNVTITSTVTPTISITADPSTPVGANSSVYVSASVTHAGSSPEYEWKLNGNIISNASSIVVPNAADGDKIVATLSSSASCITSPTAASNEITLSVNNSLTQSNHSWAQRASQPDVSGNPTIRVNGSGFSIDISNLKKAYVGVGYVGTTSNLRNDFWEYDPSTDVWTQKATFIGLPRYNAVGFSINGKGYIGLGTTGAGLTNDFYQYDPTTNTWIARTPFPGAAREQAFGFGIGLTKGYVGGGYSPTNGDFNDFYEFDQNSNVWNPKANFGGGKRFGSATFSISALGKGYVAGGYSTTTSSYYKDLWAYDQANNIWTKRADMPVNTGRTRMVGFSVGGNGYVGLGYSVTGAEGSFFKYIDAFDTWTSRPSYPGPSSMNGSIGMTINNRAFVYKDGALFEYNIFTTTSFSSKICSTESVPITFDASGFIFNPANVFTALLSSRQDFAVSTQLGTVTSNVSSGTVNASFQNPLPSGVYYLKVVSSLPQLSTFVEQINITSLPSTQNITTPGAAVCKGIPTTFTTNLSGTGFQWYKNNIAVGADSPYYTDDGLQDKDAIKVVKTYTQADGCSGPTGVGSNLINMVVNAPKVPTVTVTQPNKLSSSAAIQYQWYLDGDAISKATSQSYTMLESGIYKVRTLDLNGCLAFSDDIPNAFTGLYEEELTAEVRAFPNPVAGEMTLEVSEDLVRRGVDYSVFNDLGQSLFAAQKALRSNKIDLSGKAPGLYLVRLSINGSTIVRRVMKVD